MSTLQPPLLVLAEAIEKTSDIFALDHIGTLLMRMEISEAHDALIDAFRTREEALIRGSSAQPRTEVIEHIERQKKAA